jgi:hypothetical protein
VVASGVGNTDFSLQRPGLCYVETGLRYLGNAGSGERTLYLQTGSTFDVTQRITWQAMNIVGAGGATLVCSTIIRIAAITDVFAAGSHNAGSNVNTDVASGKLITSCRPGSHRSPSSARTPLPPTGTAMLTSSAPGPGRSLPWLASPFRVQPGLQAPITRSLLTR